jgi:hypothetical protein
MLTRFLAACGILGILGTAWAQCPNCGQQQQLWAPQQFQAPAVTWQAPQAVQAPPVVVFWAPAVPVSPPVAWLNQAPPVATFNAPRYETRTRSGPFAMRVVERRW